MLRRRTFDRLVVLLPASDGSADRLFELTGTTLALYDCFAASASIDEVVRRLSERYDATVEQVATDVVPAVEALLHQGLLTVAR